MAGIGRLEGNASSYRIGAVARLTGIPADTIRMWERRYRVVTPQRGEGRYRLYTRQDIARLALVKRLVDAGNAIGTVAGLSGAQLEERLEAQQGVRLTGPHAARTRPPRLAILGDALPARIDMDASDLRGVQVVLVERDAKAFEEGIADVDPDVIVLELPTVHTETAAEITRLSRLTGARLLIVVYAFGARRDIRRLESDRVKMLRAPVDIAHLRDLCLMDQVAPGAAAAPQRSEAIGDLLGAPLPGRRFDTKRLAHIATVSTNIRCECPHHLVDLIYGLSAFETYSTQCESRNRDDAAVHALLHAATARARALIEEALQSVIDHEGIEV